MAIADSAGLMQRAAKDLNLAWQRARSQWGDEMARAFQYEHIEPLEKHLRTTGTALEHMAEVLYRVRKDCE